MNTETRTGAALSGRLASRQSDLKRAAAGQDHWLQLNTCQRTLDELTRFLPVLGFVLRSTNVRTAFEIHGPLLRLTREFLGADTRLLVSSEWEYSPYTYSPLPDFADFVLIGFPASESANPLVVPLAGHELGHSLWSSKRLQTDVSSAVTTSIATTFSRTDGTNSVAISQTSTQAGSGSKGMWPSTVSLVLRLTGPFYKPKKPSATSLASHSSVHELLACLRVPSRSRVCSVQPTILSITRDS